jgi:transposase
VYLLAAHAIPVHRAAEQKISGRLLSEQATRHRYAIRGNISTAAKHSVSVFTALRDALTGNAWMPPIPSGT